MYTAHWYSPSNKRKVTISEGGQVIYTIQKCYFNEICMFFQVLLAYIMSCPKISSR